ncbi:HD domain-containing protein [Candidatus Woesearchaeota archaeon]|nr:HD domain-containing protein [Candidatus Woesearchaeota archaeon]
MSRIDDALRFAIEAHEGQRRKVSGIPFVIHLTDVMKFLMYDRAEEDVVVAGILHDTIEDTDVSAEELEGRFGSRVRNLVEFCTEPENTPDKGLDVLKKSWRRRKESIIAACRRADHDELLIELADKLSNLSSLRDDLTMDGAAVWDHFHADHASQEWYFRTLADIFVERLSHTRMWRLFEAALEDVFGEEEKG